MSRERMQNIAFFFAVVPWGIIGTIHSMEAGLAGLLFQLVWLVVFLKAK